jgi:hypothetical protein
MPRRRRTSRVLEKAQFRAAGLKAIDPSIDFGDNCNLQDFTQQIENLRNKLDAYNTTLALIDSIRTQIEVMEKSLSLLSETMLLGVACKYGKDSIQYVMAGGVRKSDRIRKSTATRYKNKIAETSSEAYQSV